MVEDLITSVIASSDDGDCVKVDDDCVKVDYDGVKVDDEDKDAERRRML